MIVPTLTIISSEVAIFVQLMQCSINFKIDDVILLGLIETLMQGSHSKACGKTDSEKSLQCSKMCTDDGMVQLFSSQLISA